MKKVYSVSYDFKGCPKPDMLPALAEALQGFGNWWHYLNGTWVIATDLTADAIFTRLEPVIDNRLHILVAELGADFFGRLPKDAGDWIRDHRREKVTETERPHESAVG